MALFVDDSSPSPSRRSRRERIGWGALTIAVVIGVIFMLLPSPYVIEEPGPVYDTLGVAGQDGEEIPLIEIPDEQTFPTEGELNLLTVSVRGRPGATPGWLDVIGAWFDRTRSVVPVEAVFPPGISDADRDAQNEAAMVDSQQDATAAALVELGYEFPREVTVAGVLDDSPAAGSLIEGDIITGVNGTDVNSVDELRAEVRENGTETPAELTVVRDGTERVVEVTPVETDGNVVLGVGVRMAYEFPIDVELQLDNVGGPSAGMMFALGIVDKLTPGPMTGGEIIAGTGTIDSAGQVGAIGGIRQKLWGAEDVGAEWFLAPASNCDEVTGHVPDGMRVFAVETLDQAREIVEAVGEGVDTERFAGCPTS
ncbi:PDZ domain-containing protein [Agromyces sp. Marseille-P2726]|uniref:YlbL family protein n=1 Tax=Agromyces sp. Marseille-P2726 TaxID=2709132 RepID=UPI00156EE1D0|nr:PDZ domain-containing protein [Agromyces sp. Marseille-P2726]